MSSSKPSSLRLSVPCLPHDDDLPVATPNNEQNSRNPPAAVNLPSKPPKTGPERNKKIYVGGANTNNFSTGSYRPSLSMLLRAPIRNHHLDDCVIQHFYTPQPSLKTYPFPYAHHVTKFLQSDSTFRAIDAVHASNAAILESAKRHADLYESHVNKVADADAQLRDALRNFRPEEIVMIMMNLMNCEGQDGVHRALESLDALNQRLTASGRDALHFYRDGWYIDHMLE